MENGIPFVDRLLKDRITAVLPLLVMTSSTVHPSPGYSIWDPVSVRALLVSDHFSGDQLNELATYFEKFKALGINMLILEVNYHFQFRQYPYLEHPSGSISWRAAREFSLKAEDAGITVIPLFHVLGMQSSGQEVSPLLKKYPEFDTTPDSFPYNSGLVYREWDPLNEQVDEIVFTLLEEIIEAFHAPALHIGMGEILLLGHPRSPSTHNKNPAVLFAYVTTVYRNFLIGTLNKGMLMWGDRLINGHAMDFGPWESSQSGTAEAIDLIPRDIIVCPWHYSPRPDYPSIPEFTQRGFRVLPMCWKNEDAISELFHYCHSLNDPLIRGHIFSSWNVKTMNIPDFPPLKKGIAILDTLAREGTSQELNTL